MDLEQAIALVLAEAKRTGNNAVARRLEVANGTVSKWKGGKRPEGEVRGRVFAFAEELARRFESAGLGGDVRIGVRVSGALDPVPPRVAPPVDPVEAVVQEGQRELSRWAKDFAARLLRASATRVESMPDDVLQEREDAIRDVQEQLGPGVPRVVPGASAPTPPGQRGPARKSAAGGTRGDDWQQ
ncbi:MAG: hypothetical protein K2R93_12535 [Gemmatimonadaceae bacterium]|nr:hypothetical protein [Gemmatimonadaceae bacterium]